MRIKKGDNVQVISGRDSGKKGKIIKVIPKENRVVVEGINKMKKHQRPTRALPQGGILQIEAPLNASNVMLICGSCKNPARVGHQVLKSNEKVRVCKKCGEVLD